MMFKANAFSYVATSLMILSLKIATNDGEMFFHLADSNFEYCLLTYYSSAYIYIYILHILNIIVYIHHSYSSPNLWIT